MSRRLNKLVEYYLQNRHSIIEGILHVVNILGLAELPSESTIRYLFQSFRQQVSLIFNALVDRIREDITKHWTRAIMCLRRTCNVNSKTTGAQLGVTLTSVQRILQSSYLLIVKPGDHQQKLNYSSNPLRLTGNYSLQVVYLISNI